MLASPVSAWAPFLGTVACGHSTKFLQSVPVDAGCMGSGWAHGPTISHHQFYCQLMTQDLNMQILEHHCSNACYELQL